MTLHGSRRRAVGVGGRGGGLVGLGGGRWRVTEVAAVAVGAARGGSKHLAGEGLVTRVADDGAHVLQAVREPAPAAVGAGAALPLVAQLRLLGALPVRLQLHHFSIPLLLVLSCLLQSPFPIARSIIRIGIPNEISRIECLVLSS